ncbi:hypothetical protein B566_EDAN009141 [Ephemera danica]|nr:hypothetical protein B566_EDAN009141 [Ephemera danica]
MSTLVIIVLLATLSAVSYAKPVEIAEDMTKNSTALNYYRASTFNNKVYWTSGHKIGRSTWLWINGENIIFSDWYSGQPSDPTSEHCLILFMGNWHSYPCHYLQTGDDTTGFICEERVVV